jgi:N-acetylneuraminic acid mutarotase
LLIILLLTTISNILATSPAAASNEPSTPQEVVANSWTELAPLSAPRSSLGVASVDGKIYVIGGKTRGGGGDIVGTNEMYDPVNNTWTTKASMPTPRAHFGIAVYQNKIYCLGGKNASWAECTVNEVYDPTTDTWETKAPLLTARHIPETNVANGNIYLMGGYPDKALVEAYDPEADNWTTKAPIPYMVTEGDNSAADYSASAVVDDKIYWIGVTGFYYSPLGMRILTQLYDPETDCWSLRASPPNALPTQLPDAAAVTTGKWAPERIYVFGSGTHVAYDPTTDKWSFTAKMPMPHGDFGIAVVEDKLYAIGGGYLFSACELNLQYTPIGYGTVPPTVSTTSSNSTFTAKDELMFTTNRPVVQMNYSLDGQTNATFAGTLSLAGLALGSHNITVYAVDTFGNVGISDTIYFTINQEPLGQFPFALGVIACVAIAVGALSLLIYKKRKPSGDK